MNVNQEVERWFEESEHPLKAEMKQVREIILSSSSEKLPGSN